MKIRNGFVSNSSSSSFILAFPKFPKSVRDVREMLLDNPDEIFYEEWNNEVIPMELIMERVFKDLSEYDDGSDRIDVVDWSEINISDYDINEYDHLVSISRKDEYNKLKLDFSTFNEIKNDLYQDFHKDNDKEKKTEIQTEIEKAYTDMNTVQDKMIDIIKKSVAESEVKNYHQISIEYSDNDGKIDTIIEHGGILDKITVQRINNH